MKRLLLALLLPTLLFAVYFLTTTTKIETILGDTAQSTEIVIYKETGEVNETQTGSCWTFSNMAPINETAWRCKTDKFIYDPCFAVTNSEVICRATPFEDSIAVKIELAEAIPKSTIPKVEAGEEPELANWAFELENGVKCFKYNGTASAVDEGANLLELYYYKCDNSEVIVGFPDTSEPVWKVKVANIESKPASYKTLKVVKAWR